MKKPLHVFCCYAHEDQKFLHEIKKRLMPLQHDGLMNIYAYIDISPGEEWESKINYHLDTAHIILLLVSSDFIASDYCYSKEMIRALERHDGGDAYIIPILLRPTDLQRTPFGKIQSLPTDTKPITKWTNRDDAFLDVVHDIEKVVLNLTNTSKVTSVLPSDTLHFVPNSSRNLGYGGHRFYQTEAIVPPKSREEAATKEHMKAEQEAAEDNQREAALQMYINAMSELLLEKNLGESEVTDQVRTIARVRTLTILPRLDRKRKRNLLLFLHEAGLIDKWPRIINVSAADFSEADWSKVNLCQYRWTRDNSSKKESITRVEADLSGINLRNANLNEADLCGVKLGAESELDLALEIESGGDNIANLSGAKLVKANLRNAQLGGVDLHGVDLRKANLSGAYLQGANLSEANLHGAELGIQPQIDLCDSPEDLSDIDTWIGANLCQANLSGADLSEAKLWQVDLCGADLSEANLSGADLRGAILREPGPFMTMPEPTNLEGANLERANLEGAKGITTEELEKRAKSLKGATMPDGSIHP